MQPGESAVRLELPNTSASSPVTLTSAGSPLAAPAATAAAADGEPGLSALVTLSAAKAAADSRARTELQRWPIAPKNRPQLSALGTLWFCACSRGQEGL